MALVRCGCSLNKMVREGSCRNCLVGRELKEGREQTKHITEKDVSRNKYQ